MSELALPPISQIYTQRVFDQDQKSFGGSRALFRLAANRLGVNLLPQEDLAWRAMLGGACLLDELVDNGEADVLGTVKQILTQQFRVDINAQTQEVLYDYMSQQTQTYSEGVLRGVARAHELALRQRETLDPHRLVAVRLEEADVLSALLSLRTSGQPDAAARKQLNAVIGAWSRTGYLVDSFVDLRSDYEGGESGIKPSAYSALIIASATARESVGAIRSVPLGLLGSCAMTGVNYLIHNRKVNVRVDAASSQIGSV